MSLSYDLSLLATSRNLTTVLAIGSITPNVSFRYYLIWHNDLVLRPVTCMRSAYLSCVRGIISKLKLHNTCYGDCSISLSCGILNFEMYVELLFLLLLATVNFLWFGFIAFMSNHHQQHVVLIIINSSSVDDIFISLLKS